MTKKTQVAETAQAEATQEQIKVEDLSLGERLLAVQSELNAPKDKYNSYGNYAYRSAEGILEALKPLLKKYALLLTLTDEPVQVGERYYIKAQAMLRMAEEPFGVPVTVTAFAREDENKKGMDQAMLSGSCSSYSRKYCLNAMFLCDDTKDPDTDEYQAQTSGVKTGAADKDAILAEIEALKSVEDVNNWWLKKNKSLPADMRGVAYNACKGRAESLRR